MNIHEYQAKEIFARHGVKVPRGKVAFSLPEAEAAASSLGPGPFVVKAQIHAGGRGKGGGGFARPRTWRRSAKSDGRCSG